MFTSILTPKSKSKEWFPLQKAAVLWAGDALRLVPAREVGPECTTCPDGGLSLRNFWEACEGVLKAFRAWLVTQDALANTVCFA